MRRRQERDVVRWGMMEDYTRGRDDEREMAALRLLQAATAAAAKTACVCMKRAAAPDLLSVIPFLLYSTYCFFICFFLML